MRHSKAREVKASSVAALLFFLNDAARDGTPEAFPFGIFGGDATGIGAITGRVAVWLGCPPGLTLADVPPTECFEESSVETFRGKLWCGRRGMFW